MAEAPAAEPAHPAPAGAPAAEAAPAPAASPPKPPKAEPVKAFTRNGKKVRVFHAHPLLEDLPPGWILEQVDRLARGGARTFDNYWICPETEKRFDSRRKVQAYLGGDDEAHMGSRRRARGAEMDIVALRAAKRTGGRSDGDIIESVVRDLVDAVEGLEQPRLRATRTAPATESAARRAEQAVSERFSGFLLFSFEQHPQAGTLDMLGPAGLARACAARWERLPRSEQAAYSERARKLSAEFFHRGVRTAAAKASAAEELRAELLGA